MDYKISKTIEHANGDVAVFLRYYDGAVTTEDEFDDETGGQKPVTRYRRTAILSEEEITLTI